MQNIIIPEQNLIDLSAVPTADRMLLELDNILGEDDLKGKIFKVNLGDVYYTPTHINTLNSMLEEYGAGIELIIAKSVNTQLAAIESGFAVTERLPEKSYQVSSDKSYESFEIEKTEESKDMEVISQLRLEIEDVDDSENEEIKEAAVQIAEVLELASDIPVDIDTEKALEDFLENEAKEVEIQEKQTDDIKNDVKLESQSKKNAENHTEKTLYIKQTLRSGRTINYDGNIFIIGDCHPGSEIIASGDINVWGVLSGIAQAGSNGNKNASIRALKINAIQLRIANMLSRKPDRLLVEKTEKTTNFTPEEAKIENGEIKIFSYNY